MSLWNKIRKLGRKPDECIGTWETSNDGGIHIIFGSRLIINPDGTGLEESWGYGEEEEPYEYKHKVYWHRKDATTLKLGYKPTELTEVKYLIEPYTGPYDQEFDMLFEPGHIMEKHPNIGGFWKIAGRLFRMRN